MVRYEYDGEDFPRYMSVEQRRAKARERAKRLAEERREAGGTRDSESSDQSDAAEPAVPETQNPRKRSAPPCATQQQPPRPAARKGRRIAASFWGQAWCRHLATYAACGVRLARGRSCLGYGGVLDLAINAGRIDAKVSGSELYDVTVSVAPMPEEHWEAFVRRCSAGSVSMAQILKGELPEELLALATDPEHGLFPTGAELKATCTCLDWAPLCKHAAAALYGVGSRLDEEPLLLFTLRGLDVERLAEDARKQLLDQTAPAVAPGSLTGDLGSLFGLDLDV